MILVDTSVWIEVFRARRPLDLEAVREWLDCDPVFVPVPGPRHHEILERLVLECSQQHHHVPDAHLAALAIEHGLILATHDRGSARFKACDVSCRSLPRNA